MTLREAVDACEDPSSLLESIDPDWSDHFSDAWEGLNYYVRWAPETVAEVLQEV